MCLCLSIRRLDEPSSERSGVTQTAALPSTNENKMGPYFGGFSPASEVIDLPQQEDSASVERNMDDLHTVQVPSQSIAPIDHTSEPSETKNQLLNCLSKSFHKRLP